MLQKTQNNLVRVVAVVRAKLATLPPYDFTRRDEHNRQVQAIFRALETEEKARRGSVAGSDTITMAGVRSTCSSGGAELLSNWIAAANRRLDKAVTASWGR